MITDQWMPAGDHRGQIGANALPAPDRYDVGNRLEVVVSEAHPRIAWRVACLDVQF